MLDSFPLTQVLRTVFKGEGDCAEAGWTFLSLSIAEWALLWFLLFLLAGLRAAGATAPSLGVSQLTHH